MKRQGPAGNPVTVELRTGFRRISEEFRRLHKRFGIQLCLRRLDRVERRAMREVAWQRRELRKAEENLSQLKFAYENHRRSLRCLLAETDGGAARSRDAAA